MQSKNIMVSSYARNKEASQAKYISILNIIQGEVDPTQVMAHKFFVGLNESNDGHIMSNFDSLCHAIFKSGLPFICKMSK